MRLNARFAVGEMKSPIASTRHPHDSMLHGEHDQNQVYSPVPFENFNQQHEVTDQVISGTGERMGKMME